MIDHTEVSYTKGRTNAIAFHVPYNRTIGYYGTTNWLYNFWNVQGGSNVVRQPVVRSIADIRYLDKIKRK